MPFQGPRLRISSALNSEWERLSQRVVIAVTGGADRGDRAGLGQALGVPHGDVLPGRLVRVMDQARSQFNRGSPPGPKLHLLTDATDLPLAVATSAANTHDSLALIPLVQAIPAIRSLRGPRRRRPAKLHADKGYDYPHLRAWLRRRRIPRGSPAAAWRTALGWAGTAGSRAINRLADRLPPADPAVRAIRPAVHRIPHPRRQAHLLQEARQADELSVDDELTTGFDEKYV